MKIESVRKKVSLTELGITGNERGIEVYKEIQHMLPKKENGIDFSETIKLEDKTTKIEYEFRIYKRPNSNQVWIKPWTAYFSSENKNIQPFDELVIEKVVNDKNEVKYYIDVDKYQLRIGLLYKEDEQAFELNKKVQSQLDQLIEGKSINIRSIEGEVIKLDIEKRNDLYFIKNLYKVVKKEEFDNSMNKKKKQEKKIILELVDEKTQLYSIFIWEKYLYTKIEY